MTGALPIRIAMWSGPRNISTAMMRAWENRGDTAAIDEPFYAAYLAATGLDHPMRDAVLASQPQDWRDVFAQLMLPPPGAPHIQYEKHMTHHMLPGFGVGWMAVCRNAFLIRHPARVIASYRRARRACTLADIGIVRQCALFDAEAARLGHAPPVIDADDILAAPGAMLRALCAALGVPFTPNMLTWPAGRRISDGAWAPAWYGAVERSTSFASPAPAPSMPDGPAQRLAEQAAPFYERLAAFRLRAACQPAD